MPSRLAGSPGANRAGSSFVRWFVPHYVHHTTPGIAPPARDLPAEPRSLSALPGIHRREPESGTVTSIDGKLKLFRGYLTGHHLIHSIPTRLILT